MLWTVVYSKTFWMIFGKNTISLQMIPNALLYWRNRAHWCSVICKFDLIWCKMIHCFYTLLPYWLIWSLRQKWIWRSKVYVGCVWHFSITWFSIWRDIRFISVINWIAEGFGCLLLFMILNRYNHLIILVIIHSIH